MESNRTCVIDNGSYMIKAGYAKEYEPSFSCPTIIGYPKTKNQMHNIERKEFYVGQEAQKLRKFINVSYPVEEGAVQNWDEMEKIWEFCF